MVSNTENEFRSGEMLLKLHLKTLSNKVQPLCKTDKDSEMR